MAAVWIIYNYFYARFLDNNLMATGIKRIVVHVVVRDAQLAKTVRPPYNYRPADLQPEFKTNLRLCSLTALLAYTICIHSWFDINRFYIMWSDQITFWWVPNLLL